MKTMALTMTVLGAMLLNAHADTSVVTVTNKLGLKLAQESAKMLSGKNYMVSPLSLQQALNLAVNGTAGQTRHEVESLLGANVDGLNVESAQNVKRISFSVEQKKKLQEENKHATPAVVSVQNSIWNTNGKTDGRHFEFSASFRDAAQKFYGAESASHDFKTQGAVDAINGWADKKTFGLVKKIIDLDALKPMLWVVMNATYIEASWRQAFHRMPVDQEFILADGQKITAPTIASIQHIGYTKLDSGAELAAIPFATAEGSPELEFVVYLPALGADFAQEQAQLFDHAFWLKSEAALKTAESRVKAQIILPKFSFDTSVEIVKDSSIAKGMGLNFLFENDANFSLMATADSRESKVGLIKQNSRIELDEKGVKAAAVTIIGGIERTSMPRPPQVSLTVDRPFMFAIVEKSTKTILFTGSVVDPR